MQVSERSDGTNFDRLNESSAEPAGSDPAVSGEREAQRRWSAEERMRIVRESFWPGNQVGDVARRYGLNRKQLSAWHTQARRGKLALPSSTVPEPEPVAVIDKPELERAFATLEVDAPTPRAAIGPCSSLFWDSPSRIASLMSTRSACVSTRRTARS